MSESSSERDGVAIRPAQRADLESLEDFLRPYVEAKQILPRTADELVYLLSTGFVAETVGGERGPRIVGFVTLEIYSLKLAELRSLTVDPAYRSHGVGSRLIAACVELAKTKGVFEVLAVTAAEELFQKHGFDAALPGQKKALFLQTRETFEEGTP